jgi:hypothetical protein
MFRLEDNNYDLVILPLLPEDESSITLEELIVFLRVFLKFYF